MISIPRPILSAARPAAPHAEKAQAPVPAPPAALRRRKSLRVYGAPDAPRETAPANRRRRLFVRAPPIRPDHSPHSARPSYVERVPEPEKDKRCYVFAAKEKFQRRSPATLFGPG